MKMKREKKDDMQKLTEKGNSKIEKEGKRARIELQMQKRKKFGKAGKHTC